MLSQPCTDGATTTQPTWRKRASNTADTLKEARLATGYDCMSDMKWLHRELSSARQWPHDKYFCETAPEADTNVAMASLDSLLHNTAAPCTVAEQRQFLEASLQISAPATATRKTHHHMIRQPERRLAAPVRWNKASLQDCLAWQALHCSHAWSACGIWDKV